MPPRSFSQFPYSNQVGIIVLVTILVFFVIAFAGRAVEQYRVERQLEAVDVDVSSLEKEHQGLRVTATHMSTSAYKDEELRKAGYLPPYETPVAAQIRIAIPEKPEQSVVSVALPAPVQPVRFDSPPYWGLWRRLLWD